MDITDSNGVRAVDLNTKMGYLRACLYDECPEDAAGHLCDLLEYCRQRITPSVGPPLADLTEMVMYYGKNQTRIVELSTMDSRAVKP